MARRTMLGGRRGRMLVVAAALVVPGAAVAATMALSDSNNQPGEIAAAAQTSGPESTAWTALAQVAKPSDNFTASISELQAVLETLPPADVAKWRTACELHVAEWREAQSTGGVDAAAGTGWQAPTRRPAPAGPAPQLVRALANHGSSAEIETIKNEVNRMRAEQTVLELDPPLSPTADQVRASLLEIEPQVLADVWSTTTLDQNLSVTRQNLCVKLLQGEQWGSRELRTSATWVGVQVTGETAIAVYNESRHGLTNLSNDWSLQQESQIQLQLVREAGQWRIEHRTEVYLNGG